MAVTNVKLYIPADPINYHMEQENVTFLKRLGLCVAPVFLATAVGMASADSDGPLYVGFSPSKLKQEHSVNVGPLYVQWGKMEKQEEEETTAYRGGK